MLTLKTINFQSVHKNKVNFYPAQKQVNFGSYTKMKSIYIPRKIQSQFRPQHWSSVNFDPPSINSQFCMPPDTKTKCISIQIPNQVIFDPHTQPSQFWSPHWNQVNFDSLHWNQDNSDPPHNNQVNFNANTKSMSFSGSMTLRVIHMIQHMFLWCSSNTYNIVTSINSCYSLRFHTTVKPRKIA